MHHTMMFTRFYMHLINKEAKKNSFGGTYPSDSEEER